MKVGEKTNFGRLATIFQICLMDADILLSTQEVLVCINTIRIKGVSF